MWCVHKYHLLLCFQYTMSGYFCQCCYFLKIGWFFWDSVWNLLVFWKNARAFVKNGMLNFFCKNVKFLKYMSNELERRSKGGYMVDKFCKKILILSAIWYQFLLLFLWCFEILLWLVCHKILFGWIGFWMLLQCMW